MATLPVFDIDSIEHGDEINPRDIADLELQHAESSTAIIEELPEIRRCYRHWRKIRLCDAINAGKKSVIEHRNACFVVPSIDDNDDYYYDDEANYQGALQQIDQLVANFIKALPYCVFFNLSNEHLSITNKKICPCSTDETMEKWREQFNLDQPLLTPCRHTPRSGLPRDQDFFRHCNDRIRIGCKFHFWLHKYEYNIPPEYDPDADSSARESTRDYYNRFSDSINSDGTDSMSSSSSI